MPRILIAALVVGGGLFLTFLLTYRPPVVEIVPSSVQGAAVFRETCAPCHGPQGEGMAGLTPPLRGRGLSAAEIKEVVQKGRNRMPALPGIQGEALENVARYASQLQ